MSTKPKETIKLIYTATYKGIVRIVPVEFNAETMFEPEEDTSEDDLNDAVDKALRLIFPNEEIDLRKVVIKDVPNSFAKYND